MNNSVSTLKKASFLKWFVIFLVGVSLSLLLPYSLIAATMDDYCIIPPFVVGGGMKSNLLLMIDNSGSMYDLQYIDEGRQDSTGAFTREPTYCYDQTYKSMACSNDRTQNCAADANCSGGGTCEKNVYGGYFDFGRCSVTTSLTCVENSDCPAEPVAENCNEVIYSYDSEDQRFVPGAAFPVPCTNEVPGTLCVNIAGDDVTAFVAKGNYLNWLTSSKFDVEKQVLTGGKYDTVTHDLLAETRGCVGRRFIKEANTADFVNYDSPEPDPSPNTSLGVTFGIKCPENENNVLSVCYGGQTLIEIFKGDFDPSGCDTAIDLLEAGAQKQKIEEAIESCLEITASNKKFCQSDTRDPKPICNADFNDCIKRDPEPAGELQIGTCSIANNGVCEVDTAGTCSVTDPGICTADNGVCGNSKICFGGTNDGNACNNVGQCPGATSCSKPCVGGGKAGATCNNDNDCKISTCSVGNVGSICTVNANCDIKACSAGKVGSCVVNQDCDLKSCTAPLSRDGDSCAVNTDCNSSACVEPGPDALIGTLCSENWDCSDTYGHCLAPATTQLASTFTQSMHTCYQVIIKDAVIGPEDINQVSNPAGCGNIYANYKICLGGANDGSVCTGDADCGAGTCENGPDYLYPGNPAYLCNTNYAGYCAEMSAPDWAATTWVAREYSSPDECITEQYKKYCGELELPPVIDPSDDPSDTSSFANLPAILADTGSEAQLGEPIAEFPVKVDRTANPDPSGLIQEFSNRIRFGAMSFNFNGTATECAVATLGEPNPEIPCPKTCSNNRSLACIDASDCPDPASNPTCDATVANLDNLDGGKIIHYIGTPWKCSINTGTPCSEDFQCPDFDTGETCNTVGDHEKGTCSDTAASCSYDYDCPAAGETCNRTLVHTIDSIRGDAWTPFSEAFLEAIGYYAKETAEAHDPNPLVYGTSRIDDSGMPLRLNDPDYVTDKNPSQYRCQANNLLLISDGMSTADQNFNLTPFVDSYNDGDGLTGSGVGGCPKYSGSRDLDDLAWLAQHRTITDFNQAADDPAVPESSYLYKKIRTYTVYNGASSNDPDECNPETLLQEAADNGRGIYARTEDPAELEKALKNIFLDISGKASSGTAASVLASGEESGANLLQAVFYPSRGFGGDTIAWTGTLQNLWYYIHPLFEASSIREDTVQDGILHLQNDYVASFHFDQPSQTTKVFLLKDDGVPSTAPVLVDDIAVEDLKNIWEAGKILWKRNVKAGGNPRNIKTYIGETGVDGNPAFKNFSTANRTALKPYLQAASDAESEAVIRYIHGEDTVCSITKTTACSQDTDCPGGETCGGFNPIVDINGDSAADFTGAYRSRTVGIDLNGDGDTVDAGENNVWKLGDIISSTPKVVSWVPLNTYDLKYSDTTYAKFSCRKTRDTADCTTGYDERGTVFTGANDGMLHAFKLGLLQVESDPTGPEVARIINPATGAPCLPTDANKCGEEIWAFIPKHVLPYLKYNADTGYCHIYNIDGIPYVFDASIGGDAGVQRLADGTSWKTVLIGSMKYGGACKAANTACFGGGTNCVKAPGVDLNGDGDTIDIVDGNDESKLGMSSYFALDITDNDPNNWKLLWEFSDENIPAAELLADGGLGFSTANQAIVRINPSAPANCSGCNGEWFVLIPSGPTGPIDTDSKQFMGRSDQKLKVFVLDLRTGTLLKTFNSFGGEITNAFGGSILRSTLDPDLDYQDDAVFLGYTRSSTGVGDSWTEGGVLAIMTNEEPSPANWTVRKIMDGIGPVTSAIDKLQNTRTNQLWLYFGTGRYFYKDLGVIDDSTGARKIYGIQDPCYLSAARNQDADKSFDLTCGDTVSSGDLDDVTDAPDNAEDDEGWFINLEGQNVPDTGYDAERVISDPVASVIGVTFFTTFKPSADVCGFGGRSHLWAVKSETGGTATSRLRGKALMQVSTGSIEEVDLKKTFEERPIHGDPGDVDYDPGNPDSHGDRRTGAITGKPPEGPGLILLISPPPREKAVHTREK